jgi:single-stranded DNA-binding protein
MADRDSATPACDGDRLPRALVNVFAGVGRVVDDAQFFATRGGRPKISFRLAIPRHPRLPRKKPATGDFYSVICYGEKFVPLLDHLVKGCEVVVVGWAQSRDLKRKRDGTVNEIGAQAVVLALDANLLAALERLVEEVLAGLTPQEREDVRAALVEGGWESPQGREENPPWLEKVACLFAGDGRVHPEVRLAVARVLEGSDSDGEG